MTLVILLCALSMPLKQCTYWTAKDVAFIGDEMTITECLQAASRMNIVIKNQAGRLVARGENARVFCQKLQIV